VLGSRGQATRPGLGPYCDRVPPAPRARDLTVFGVGSTYAWDVVEAALRRKLSPRCVDNWGGADARLPGLDDETDPAAPFVLGLSSSLHRAAGAHAAFAAGYLTPTSLTDPSAVVAGSTTLGHGSFLNAGVVVGPHTTIGCHTNLHRSVSIGNVNDIGFAVAFGPGAVTADDVRVEAAAFIGAGAVVLPGVRIGRRAVVGAGAVVTRDVDDFEFVTGNPAKVQPARKHIEPVADDVCPHCAVPPS
jgi:acetyltransferase-like isoleucine patch superfamily enzyme